MEKIKKCSKCGESKPLTKVYFPIRKEGKDGYRNVCKKCQSLKRKEYYENNKEKELNQTKIRYEQNKERIRRQYREYYRNNVDKVRKKNDKWLVENKDKRKEYQKNYYKENKSKYRKRAREWQSENRKTEKGRILNTMRVRLNRVTKGLEGIESTKSLIGCTFEEFKEHIESQFQPGMSWENYGLFGWHIDHIKPVSLFNMEDSEERKECFHYSNLQPLWAEQNLKKSNKYDKKYEKLREMESLTCM